MKAVLISPHPGVNTGGVERFCFLLDSALRSAGWETVTVGPAPPAPALLGRLGLQPGLSALTASRRARRERPDLVISNGFLGGPTGTPRIHVFHGTMIRHIMAGGSGSRRYRLRQALSAGLIEAVSARGATAVAVSSSAADELGRFYRQPVAAVIPNGVDTELFVPGDRGAARRELGLDPNARYALYVGRLEYRKGADLVPEACRRAGFELLIAGPEAPSGATGLGTLEPARLAAAYRAADCVLFPTRYEACSFVVLEALASGVPLVTTTAGWMHEFVRRCPSYSRLIVTPDLLSLCGTLDALGSLSLQAMLDEARRLVVRDNSLTAFASRWNTLAATVVAR